MPETDTCLIPSRFCGPPNSANGGYVAGLLAQRMPRGEAVVRLHQPPPHEPEHRVHPTDAGHELRAGESRVATATPDERPNEPHPAHGIAAATAASRAIRGFDERCERRNLDRDGDGLAVGLASRRATRR